MDDERGHPIVLLSTVCHGDDDVPFCLSGRCDKHLCPVQDVYKRQALLGAAIAVTVICGLTGSASGGLGIAIPLVGPTYVEMGVAPAALHRVASIASGALDSVPHNGYIAVSYTHLYFVGKPNPLMMRTGLQLLGVHSQDAAIIGDRMDTDIIAGIETGLDTCLVLSGVTSKTEMEGYPYRPRLILNGVGDIPKS